jgi:uncharacterized membrane protein
VSHDRTRQLAHSEGEYIHPENAWWHWFYLDLLSLITEIEILYTLFAIVGVVLWLISMYQLSNILGKSSIFQKFLTGFILNIADVVIAFVLELMERITSSASMRDEVVADIESWILIAYVAAHAVLVVSFYLYKQAFEILASAIAQNLFKIAGLLMFIGAIAIILFGLGLLLIIVSNIVLAVAFFKAPSELEVQAA